VSIEQKLILLGILQKKEDESLADVLKMLVNTGSFSQKQGKAALKELKKEAFIDDEGLTFKGVTAAEEAKGEFAL
jgi:polyhydroxyalkanoate synthesis regulator phasin